MNSRDLARNLAQSLTLGPWSRIFIRDTLARRFPRELQHFAEPLATELIKNLPHAYSPHVNAITDVWRSSEAFEKIFLFCKQHDVWPDPDLAPPAMSPVRAFANAELPQLPTLDALAEWLFLPIERLEYLADVTVRYEAHDDEAVNHYHYVLQTKKSGRLRIIEAPKPHLKTAQRQILHEILDRVPTHTNAFAFARGRSCIKAASRHAGEQVLVCFDLKDFFPSIRSGRIFGLFRCLGYPHEVARALTGLCTSTTPSRVVNRLDVADRNNFRRSHLPQGSPASPALANLAAFNLDRRLTGLARSLNMNFSRYADDLSFSGDSSNTGVLLRAVQSIVAGEGFHLNTAKTRIMSNTSRQVVTGIVVNQHLNVDRRYFDRLKAIIHACGKSQDSPYDLSDFWNSLLGKIAWVEAVNPQRGEKLRELLAAVIARRA
jgi:RNA-directed DNA polymerase